MKLLNLELKAVGPFTDVSLDFSRSAPGFHLIYGPNEAGKSSSLRAVSYLLFGFPHLSADHFVHSNEQLRVGGTLRHSDGEEIGFLRRRGRGNTIRALDDATIIPEERLTRFLGGVHPDMFHGLFGINHERLTQAGEEIRMGKGQLGELLFAAGAGLAGLREAQETLQARLDELFKPRGQNPKINKAVADFRAAQDELKRQQLPSEEWQRHDQAHRDAVSTADELRSRLRGDRSQQGLLKRVKSAVPLVIRRRRLIRELQDLGDVVRLRDDFGDEARAAQDRWRIAEQTILSIDGITIEIQSGLKTLNSPDPLLDAATKIELLQERLGAVEKAHDDLTNNVETILSSVEHRARQLLRELGRPTDFNEAESLRLRADEPTIIRELGQQLAVLRGHADDARRTIARHEDIIRRRELERSELDPPRDLDALRRALRQIRKAGDLDARLVDARSRFKRVQKAAQRALAQLYAWDRSADQLRELAVPLVSTLEQFDLKIQELDRVRRAVDERMTFESDAIGRLEATLRSLDADHELPTEESLASARSRRDEGWQLVKRAWFSKRPDELAADQLPFLAEFAPEPGATLATAYEISVRRGDTLADRLRHEAERVARKAEALGQLDQHRVSLSGFERERCQVDEASAVVDCDWSELVGPIGLGVQGPTPAQLREWLRQRDDIVALLEKADECAEAVEPLEREIDTYRAALSRIWDPGWGVSTPETSSLAEILDHAETLVQQQDDLGKKSATLETKISAARTEMATAELALQTGKNELDDWRSLWSVKMARIGLEPDADPKQAEVVLTHIDELFETLENRREHLKRVAGIGRDADLFARDVQALAAQVAPGLKAAPPADAARELANRLQKARSESQRRADLQVRLERELSNRHAAEDLRGQARICLERLCREAQCDDVEQLSEAERRSRARIAIESELATCEEQLLVAAADVELESFTREVEATIPEALDAQLSDLESTISSREDDLRRLDQTIGAERTELDRMDGSDRAAAAAETAQNLLARLQGDVTRYATLKLAGAILKRGIEHYRDKNQGPILTRASSLFTGLTGGSFARLQIDDDGDGRSVLKGVRPDGRLVGVEGMSDGTHDQLYLALRLASLEFWLISHEPIPFIVDDILLNFDDRRSTAALVALAEFAMRTQVLFFTHHRHVIELARANLSPDILCIHELPGR